MHARTADRSGRPFSRSPTRAAAGKVRSEPSETARTMAKGAPMRSANRAAMCDSVSTAAPPLLTRSAALLRASTTKVFAPANSALRACGRLFASRSVQALSVGKRRSALTTPVPIRRDPGLRLASNAPQRPKLRIAGRPSGNSASSRAARFSGRPPLMMVHTSGPEIIRASASMPTTTIKEVLSEERVTFPKESHRFWPA